MLFVEMIIRLFLYGKNLNKWMNYIGYGVKENYNLR